jgi:glycosyltransferase involved in cell wall biosynthesis
MDYEFEKKIDSLKNIFDNIKIMLLIDLIKHLALIILFWNFICTFNSDSLKNNYGEENIIKPNFKQYLKPEYIVKFNEYIKICKEGKLIDNNKYPLLKNPKISVIMPIFNGADYLYYSLRSIQNQDMKEIEIILVDDGSRDESFKIMNDYKKEDPRIRLIKNSDNKKILFSKSIAALNSNGKYIIELEQDDMFIRSDALDILFVEAETNNIDFVQIRDFKKTDFFFRQKTILNIREDHMVAPRGMHYKPQFELVDRNYIEDNNYLLTGALINSDIYKKAIYKLWPLISNYQMNFHEDYIITFMIITLVNKYKYLNNFALIHYIHEDSLTDNYLAKNEYYLSMLFFAYNLYDYYIKYYPYRIYILFNFINLFTNEFRTSKNLFPNLFNHVIKLFLNSRWFGDREKQDVDNRLELNNNVYRVHDIYYYLMNDNEFTELCNFQNEQIKLTNATILYKDLPYISVIIFCNEISHLKETIMSIEYQTFKLYEIILIFDNGTKNQLKKIEKFSKKFSNIKLVINEKHTGNLYSISNGLSIAKGDFILILQPGVTLYSKKTFKNLFKIIKRERPDILEFGHLINNDDFIHGNSLEFYNCEHNATKLELAYLKINKKFKDSNQKKELLFNKLIERKKLKSVVDEIFKTYINKNESIYNYYDDIILFSLNKTKAKYSITNIYGTIQYIYQLNDLKISKIMDNDTQKMDDAIFYINYLFENTKNVKYEKIYVLYEFYKALSLIFNRFNSVPDKAFELYKKFINCRVIPQPEKANLDLYINSLLN